MPILTYKKPADKPLGLPTGRSIGWRPIRVTDLLAQGELPRGKCERCSRSNLRFLHTLEQDNGRQIVVGCECAKRLCFGYEPSRNEAKLKSLFVRRSCWLSRKWRISRNGNRWLRFRSAQGMLNVTVYSEGSDSFKYIFSVGSERHCSGEFMDSDAAMLAAFDRIAEALGWAVSNA